MKKVYTQPYSNNLSISSSYGKPPKGQFEWIIADDYLRLTKKDHPFATLLAELEGE